MSTPYETAMRQRDTTTGHPDFIVAYLREEASRTKDGNPMRLSPDPMDHFRLVWKTFKDAFIPAFRAAQRTAESFERLGAAMESEAPPSPEWGAPPITTYGRIPE